MGQGTLPEIKPKFNPNKPFTPVNGKPPFDASKPFEPVKKNKTNSRPSIFLALAQKACRLVQKIFPHRHHN